MHAELCAANKPCALSERGMMYTAVLQQTQSVDETMCTLQDLFVLLDGNLLHQPLHQLDTFVIPIGSETAIVMHVHHLGRTTGLDVAPKRDECCVVWSSHWSVLHSLFRERAL
jgi:hypothetical protein